MEIEVTWKRALQVWWWYFLGRLGLTIIFGIPVFGLMAMTNIPKEDLVDKYEFIAIILGLGASFLISMLPLKWLFKTEFQGFRLALVATNKTDGAIDTQKKPS